MATPLYCHQCGTRLSAESLFCSKCGTSQMGTDHTPTSQSQPEPAMLGTGRQPAGRLLHQRYRLLQTLGQGGMGAVYLAQDTQLGDRLVAVKEMSMSRLLPPEIPQAVAQFRNEAHLLAGLHHPSLPVIHEYFSEGARWYLVMSFIEGQNLQRVLDTTPGNKLPVEQVGRIGIELCEVLEYLHTHEPQIIFRDLKPLNIMLTPKGHICLIDFGIARHFKQEQTKDTAYYYSVGYAPPEQYGQAQTGPRSDIYSLGATLHQMLSGHNPAKQPFQFASLHLTDPTLPESLSTLIARMVEMSEQARPASVAEVKEQLERVLVPKRLVSVEKVETTQVEKQPLAPQPSSLESTVLSSQSDVPTPSSETIQESLPHSETPARASSSPNEPSLTSPPPAPPLPARNAGTLAKTRASRRMALLAFGRRSTPKVQASLVLSQTPARASSSPNEPSLTLPPPAPPLPARNAGTLAKTRASRRVALLTMTGLLIIALVSGIWFATHPAKTAGIITEFSIPTANSSPEGITTGPDSNLWFTERNGNKIGRISPTGAITEFSIPTANGSLEGITTGPDGNLWFTEVDGNKIGRISPTGAITEFSIPTAHSSPEGITTGPDGNLWFTEIDGNKIGRISPTGSITEFPTPSVNSGPNVITAGPDGNLWFTEFAGDKIGRISPSGSITEFPLPNAKVFPEGITTGPDGNLWFTEIDGNIIGRISPTGSITEFPLPNANSNPDGITNGPDGNLWFAEVGNAIGRITPSGTITEFSPPTANSTPNGITTGPDHNLWFTEARGNAIGRITSGK